MTPSFRTTVLAGTLATCVAFGGHAQNVEARGDSAAFATTTLRLSGHGETRTTPDVAAIALGVETTAVSAEAAMRGNAERMSKVLAALKSAGIDKQDLATSNLSLSPQYAYEQNRPPRLTGYQASNQVSVTVRELGRLGAVADAVVWAGATNIGQINFGLANPVAVENIARIAAVKALEDKAALYANAVGYHISRLVSLTEGAASPPPPRPMALMEMRAQSAAPTPVEAGELTVGIDVSGVFELAR